MSKAKSKKKINKNSMNVDYWLEVIEFNRENRKFWKNNNLPWQIITIIELVPEKYNLMASDTLPMAAYFFNNCMRFCTLRDGTRVCCDWSQTKRADFSEKNFGKFLRRLFKLEEINPIRAYLFSKYLSRKKMLGKSLELLKIIPSVVDVSDRRHRKILERSLNDQIKSLYILGNIKEAEKLLNISRSITVLNTLIDSSNNHSNKQEDILIEQ